MYELIIKDFEARVEMAKADAEKAEQARTEAETRYSKLCDELYEAFKTKDKVFGKNRYMQLLAAKDAAERALADCKKEAQSKTATYESLKAMEIYIEKNLRKDGENKK